MKADEAAGAAAVEDIDEAAELGDGRGLGAAGGSFAEEVESAVFMDVEDGDAAAARVDGKEKRVVLAEGERALRFKRISDASAAAAVGVVGDAFAEGAVGAAFEGDDFVFVGGVGHDEDSAGVVGLGGGKSCACGAHSDGEQQETSSYVQHLQLLDETLRRTRRGIRVSLRNHTWRTSGFAQMLEELGLRKVTRMNCDTMIGGRSLFWPTSDHRDKLSMSHNDALC